MKLSRCLSVSTVVLGLIVAGCAGVKPKETSGSGGSGASNGKGGSNGSGGNRPTADALDAILPSTINTTCGNGQIDNGEKCDDGNKVGGDGCTPLCQIENGWSCQTPGQPCMRDAVCGDGMLTLARGLRRREQERRRRLLATTARASTPAGSCPRAGEALRPALRRRRHDRADETCDDGNTTNGDGCSSTCQAEPGASCPTNNGKPTPGKCTIAVCGNGVVDTGESCDCGTDPTKLPSGCTGPNGLFNGDGTGCSKTCTKEPNCRELPSGKTRRLLDELRERQHRGGRGVRRRQPGQRRRLLERPARPRAGSPATTSPKPATPPTCTQRHQPGRELPRAAGQVPRLQERERHAGGHPDFFYYGAVDPQPDHGQLDHAREHLVQTALLRAELGRSGAQERLDGPLLGSGAGEPGRQRAAGLQQHAHGRHDLRLPVHRLEPQRRQQ